MTVRCRRASVAWTISRLVLWVVALGGGAGGAGGACARAAADHQTLGDRAYAAGSYRDALAEYQLALKTDPRSAPLHARIAAAAMHVGDFQQAAREYRALATADGSRVEEAADGLERVARGSIGTNDRAALALAIKALRELTPSRPLGRYVRQVALDAADGGDPVEALALLPHAAASASDARTADSLYYLYGTVAVRLGQCDEATRVFEGILRRRREPAVLDGARAGLAMCALLEGQEVLSAGHPATAEEWFRRAASPDAPRDVARAAWLGLGDVRLAQGDVAGALEAYQQAMLGGNASDSLSRRAQDKINALGNADTTATIPEP